MDTELKILTKKLHKFQESKNENEEIKILILIGQFYYQNNEFEKSKLNFQKILEKNSKIEGINYYLALIEIQKDNLNDAKKNLKTELKINKNNKFANNLLKKLEINFNFPIITLSLIFLNILIFYFIYPQISLTQLIKYSISNNSFDIFSIISSLFFHVNILHITTNMIFLLMFGLILEKLIGSSKFLLIYLIGGIIGNYTQFILGFSNFVLGASASIFAIVGATLIREPLLKMKIFGIFKIPMIIVFGGFFVLSSFILNYIKLDNISSGEIAHITGFLVGILIIGILYRENIFVFYNWLFIAIGFGLILNSIKILILNPLNFLIIFIQIFFIIIGTILIIYSYYKLKKQVLLVGENK